MGVVRARNKPCFTTVGTCPADVPGDSERESTPSGTQTDFWRSVQDTGVARVTSNRADPIQPGRTCADSSLGEDQLPGQTRRVAGGVVRALVGGLERQRVRTLG